MSIWVKSTDPRITVVVKKSKNTIPGKEVFQGIYFVLEHFKVVRWRGEEG